MNCVQQNLLARLEAVFNRHHRPRGGADIAIEGGPRVFDVRCCDGDHTVWHWAGSADQIVHALETWIGQRGLIERPRAANTTSAR
jgi:hypothetical protein